METNLMKAGIIIIGNEIIKGLVKDENSVYICKKFHAIGVKVCKITMVPDDVEEIAEEVAKFSQRFDIVLTTGGIGPTHDDVTYEAIAAGLGDKIVLNAEMADVVRSYFHGGSDIETNPALKMAMIPQGSKLIYVTPKQEDEFGENFNGCPPGKKYFPVVRVKNVYALPGMKKWIEEAFVRLQEIFRNPKVRCYTMVKFIRLTEVKILKELNKTVTKFQKRVVIGSYPVDFNDREFLTKIVLEGASLDDVALACSYLTSLLPDEVFNNALERKNAELVYELGYGFKSLDVAVRNSIEVIEKAFEKYKSNEICISFNGGKDCTVLLHLVWAVHLMRRDPNQLNSVHLRSSDVFAEVDKFIGETIKRYNLNMTTICGSIKSALTKLHGEQPHLKAIFVGTRRTDPNSENSQSFQMCDEGWPPLMRVNPILDWTYNDVWEFLRVLEVPYCKLYDQGYTSLGNLTNTRPNSALKVSTTDGTTAFEPAYKLKDISLEREGRG